MITIMVTHYNSAIVITIMVCRRLAFVGLWVLALDL